MKGSCLSEWEGRALRLQDDAGGDAAGLDVGDRLVDVLQCAGLADDVRLAGAVQLEDLAQVVARADDRADDRDPVSTV